MRLKHLVRAGAVALLAVGLVACDGSENPRTQPTGGPEYISPAGNPVGPNQGEGEEHGEGESHSEGEAEEGTEGESQSESETAATPAP